VGRQGANPVAVADARNRGGWTLSVHHALDTTWAVSRCFARGGAATSQTGVAPYGGSVPCDSPPYLRSKALILGTGATRGGPLIGGSGSNSGYYTSEDGSEIYLFEKGVHIQTLRPMTGAVLYAFTYDQNGRLASVTQNNAITTIVRDAHGNLSAIVAPHGQRTSFAVDSHGYLSRITDPAGHIIMLTTTATGLLTSLTDANGNVSNFSYDSSGKLIKDSDAAGGSTTLTRTNIGNGYNVVERTALGITRSFQTTSTANMSSISLQSIDTGSDGLKTNDT